MPPGSLMLEDLTNIRGTHSAICVKFNKNSNSVNLNCFSTLYLNTFYGTHWVSETSRQIAHFDNLVTKSNMCLRSYLRNGSLLSSWKGLIKMCLKCLTVIKGQFSHSFNFCNFRPISISSPRWCSEIAFCNAETIHLCAMGDNGHVLRDSFICRTSVSYLPR